MPDRPHPLVIYHADCYDGFTAAWIFNRYFDARVEFHPATYGDEPPWEKVHGRNVFVVDFSYSRADMIRMNDLADRIEVLDHHKTAEANCSGLDFCTFDMERSGAGMAWDRLCPGIERPHWINCVEARDLWRFDDPATQFVHAYLTSTPMTFGYWTVIDQTPIDELVSGGVAIRRSIDMYCEKMDAHADARDFCGHRASCVNAPYLNSSELGHYLLERHRWAEVAVIFFRRRDQRWQFSLRSREGKVDVSKIAEQFGGGGHAAAAGFSADELPEDLRVQEFPL